MKDKVNPSQRATVNEKCDLLAMEGLRTLVICQKVLEENEYLDW